MDQQYEQTGIPAPASSSPTSLFQMNLDPQNSYNLRSAGSWAKVMGVVGIILGAIFIILAVIALGELNKAGGYYSYRRSSGMSMFLGNQMAAAKTGIWVFIISGILFVVAGLFSFNFGNRIIAALRANDQAGLNSGFAALRNFYALRSIVMIIVLLFFLLSFGSAL